MNRKRIGGIGLILLGILFSGCSQPQIPDGEISMTVVSDPMSETDPVSDNQGIHNKTITYGLAFTDKNIDSRDGKLILTPVLKGWKETTTAGLMVFIDGILQQYSVADSTEKTYMSQFDTVPNGNETITLTVDAVVDESLSEHYICVCSMLCPDFYPNAEQKQFGFYHSIISTKPYKLSTENLSLTGTEPPKAVRIENTVMTGSQKKQYSQGEDENHNPYIEAFELTQNGKSDNFMIDEDNSLHLSFVTCTSSPYVNDYRITFFKNHLPCKFNGDSDFLEITIEGGKISEAEVTLNNVKDGDVIYCIAIPLGDDITCNPEKSKSYLAAGKNSGGVSSDISEELIDAPISDISLRNAKPVFAIGDTAYFVNTQNFSPDTQSGILLCSSKNGRDIYKTLEIGTLLPKAHGEYISVLRMEGSELFAKLYDGELNEVKSVVLTDILGDNFRIEEAEKLNIDFDFNRIVYVSDYNRLCLRNWNSENVTELMTLPCDEEPKAENFTSISLSDKFAAFSANGRSDGQDYDFYGVCDFGGKYELHRKNGVGEPQTNGGLVVWGDRHVALDQLPSGSVEFYEKGKFGTIHTVEQAESQYVFIGAGSILTFSGNGNTLRRYAGGISKEIPLEKGEYGVAAVECGGKIFVESYGDDGIDKTYFTEVN